MKRHIDRLRRAIWTFKQPLTKVPKITGVPVSDLFIWRNSQSWETFFELIDIAGLLVHRDGMSGRYVTFIFFDHNGTQLHREQMEMANNERQSVDLSSLTSRFGCSYGTFCVFHSHTPNVVSNLGSYISERGYVSYQHADAPLRSYVHGNLDAISLHLDNTTSLLGASSFLAREFRLQHVLKVTASYEALIVNSTSQCQRISCETLLISNAEVLDMEEVQLKPGGCHLFLIKSDQFQTRRLVFKSHLVMSRPLMFCFQHNKMNVFHG